MNKDLLYDDAVSFVKDIEEYIKKQPRLYNHRR